MDNVTHSLAAMAVAEAVIQARRIYESNALEPGAKAFGESLSWRRAMYLTSLLANNLPDADLLYTGLTGGQLGYLLHHRGHTHTIVVALALAFLGLLVPYAYSKARVTLWSRTDWLWLFVMAALGPLVHLGLDFLNWYGVHALWPFDNRWAYGDSLFIIEPWIWASIVPMLLYVLRSGFWRFFWGLVLLVGLGLCWFSGMVPLVMAGVVTVWAGVLLRLMSRSSSGARAVWTLVATFAVGAIFVLTGHGARRIVERIVVAQFPAWNIEALALTPLPANPLCWGVIAVQTHRTTGEYALRRGLLATWPQLLRPMDCPRLNSDETTAPLRPVATTHEALTWGGEFVGPLQELKALSATNCIARAFLRFARTPFWLQKDGALIVGDLRFDMTPDPDFAEIATSVAPPSDCPRYVPPWVPPLAPILD